MTTLAAARAPARLALVAPLTHVLRVLVFVAMAIGLAGWMLLGVIGAAIAGLWRRFAHRKPPPARATSADRRSSGSCSPP